MLRLRLRLMRKLPQRCAFVARIGHLSTSREEQMIRYAQQSLAMPRRTVLALGLAASAGLATPSVARAKAGNVKITVLYGVSRRNHRNSEKYYAETHMPMVRVVKEIKHIELAKGLGAPEGVKPAYYRVTELWFESAEQLFKVSTTPEWKKVVDDVPNLATGGATVIFSKIE
jgi:uncharacterized protein (TIGR02118 family)